METSILKYNCRMAQTTQWLPAILDYMKNVSRTYQRPTHPSPWASGYNATFKLAVKKTEDGDKDGRFYLHVLRMRIQMDHAGVYSKSRENLIKRQKF